MTHERLGRADPHIHTLASDGVDGVVAILDHVEERTSLDVIGIADHERVDAALAARAIARARGSRVDVIVGEEVTTRSGHLLALFLKERVPPMRSLRETVARVHDQGGIAIAAHPLTPYPLCIGERAIRRLADDPDPRHRLDGIEAFNPTTFGRVGHAAVVRLADELGLPVVGSSDAHEARAIGAGVTLFPGRTADDLRGAILAGETRWAGTFHGSASQLPTFVRQLRKYGRGWGDGAVGLARGRTTGRDLGYPGGRLRPPRLDLSGIEGAAPRDLDGSDDAGDPAAPSDGWDDGATR